MCVRPIGRETVASPPSAIGLTLFAALETSSTDRETHSTECETHSTDLESHSTGFVTKSTHLKVHSTEQKTKSTHLETHSTEFVTKSSDLVTHSSDFEAYSSAKFVRSAANAIGRFGKCVRRPAYRRSLAALSRCSLTRQKRASICPVPPVRDSCCFGKRPRRPSSRPRR